MTPVCIGIAGGSASGKTTVVRTIKEAYQGRVTVISHDSYYKAQDDKPMSARILQNYDHPDAFETERLVRDLEALRAGKPVDIPVYDFAAHTRSKETRHLKPAPFLLVEGILILSDPNLRKLFDYALFLDTPEEERLARRIARDQIERGRSEASIREQIAKTVEPMYRQYVAPSKQYANRVFEGKSSALVAKHLLEWMKAHEASSNSFNN